VHSYLRTHSHTCTFTCNVVSRIHFPSWENIFLRLTAVTMCVPAQPAKVSFFCVFEIDLHSGTNYKCWPGPAHAREQPASTCLSTFTLCHTPISWKKNLKQRSTSCPISKNMLFSAFSTLFRFFQLWGSVGPKGVRLLWCAATSGYSPPPRTHPPHFPSRSLSLLIRTSTWSGYFEAGRLSPHPRHQEQRGSSWA